MNRRHSLPAEVYALVEQTPATVLLECNKPTITNASAESCTQLFTAPMRVCVANTAAEVSELFTEIETALTAGLTAAGFFAYECGTCFEPKAGIPNSRPLAWFGIYERSYCFDHATGGFINGEPQELAHFRTIVPSPAEELCVDATFGLSEEQYAQRIAAIHNWIRAGDVYQLNFTAPYSLQVRGNLAALYACLRARQPVEYGAFLHWHPGQRILSFSPELFFRVDDENDRRRITTRPMKGTAARGRTSSEDRARAEWLRNDPKNRAENLMIVDLLRNDLGRLAKFGSVHTENLFAVERHPTLWQMTSTVTAELRPEVGFRDIFRALFPCGSITGAPKVRAMQLLAQLEQQPRGVYTGAIGFFSTHRTVFNVAIRTLSMDGAQGTMGVGSGIVIDSNPAEEYRECQLKAEFLMASVRQPREILTPSDHFLLIETMLWNGSYPLIELHLDRLTDSAEFFAFPCDRDAVRGALEEHAQQFSDSASRKVRLLLDAEGSLHITDETLPPPDLGNRIGRVRIAAQRTNPADKWLYHKTTHRALYALAYQEAARAGYDDVLFLNDCGEITEGAISNIFIEKNGRLLTPSVVSGLLPGVYRLHLLQTQPNIEERVLLLDDLRTADAIYISNAVRGLRRIEIDW